jgi:hypothetical protein
MTDPAAPPDLPFERKRPNAYEWTDRAFDLLSSGKLDGRIDRRGDLEVATVVGACPRCPHQFRFESARSAVGTGGRTLGPNGPLGDPQEFEPVDVRCSCTGTHPGRQDTEAGCGIVFRIEVRPVTHDD